MNLRSYLESLAPPARAALAKNCGTSLDYLWQIANGIRTPKVQLAVAISRASGAAVSCEELLPDVDWPFLRAGAAQEERAA